jgi:cardiolipin synthase A/B
LDLAQERHGNQVSAEFLTAAYLTSQTLGILAAVHALFTVRTAQGATAWIVGLLSFPAVAVPAYLVFGCRRFDSHGRAMESKLQRHAGLMGRVLDEWQPFAVERAGLEPASVGALAELAGFEFLAGNRLRLLIDGDETFDDILREIASARESVYVQFYIVRNDDLGNRLLETLACRAEAGVKVCFLYDRFGAGEITPKVADLWRRRGIEMREFCARASGRDRWRINFRNHRKNVIVDGRTGFVGGHNVGDEYLGLNPRYGRWRDTHVRVEGPAVQQLQMVFAADWFYMTDEILPGPWRPVEPERTAGTDAPNQRALVLASGPSDGFERCTLFFLHVIGMARQRIWIASPYFVPDESVIQALQLAAVRGVEVRILIPQEPDKRLVWLASFQMLLELDHPNIHIHRFTGGFLHHKALVVDQDFAAVGTANFDNRSFRLNFELTLAVADRTFAGEVAAMFEQDFAESRECSAQGYSELSRIDKIGVRITRLLAPIL